MPLQQDLPGIASLRCLRDAEIDGDDAIDRLAFDGVVLAHADPAVAAMVDHAIGKPPVAPARERRRVSGCGADASFACR